MPGKSVCCPVETTLDILSGRWKVMIIHQLLEGTKRFNQLQRELAGITHRTLAKQLREMEEQGLILRHDFREIPPRVEYSLSPLGLTLKDVLQAMHVWAEKHGGQLPARKRGVEKETARPASSATVKTARAVFDTRAR